MDFRLFPATLMRRFSFVWVLSLALILSGFGSNMLGMGTTGSGSMGAAVVAKDGIAHRGHDHGSAGHSSFAGPDSGAVAIQSLANCCKSDGFHCGGTQAVSSAAIVLPCFPVAQRSLPPVSVSAYVGPTLARLIRPPIV